MTPRLRCLWLPLLILPTSHAAADVLYVDADAIGASDGSSWTDAFTDLGAALAAAAPGDQVWVAAGVYTPDPAGLDRSRSFDLGDGIEVYGGFAGTESCLAERDPGIHASILSGDLAGDDPPLAGCETAPSFAGNAENSRHVVRATGVGADTILDGFTITGGHADGPGFDRHGGGILILSASPQIRNCRVIRNATGSGDASADGDGGDGAGIHCELGSPVIRDTLICSNRAGEGLGTLAIPGRGGRGGGIALLGCTLPLISGCTVRDNAAGDGAESSGPSGATAHAGGDGGGIFIASSGGVRIERCEFAGNRAGRGGHRFDLGVGGAGGAGGGLAVIGSKVRVIDCRFEDNESGSSPGENSALPSGAGGGAAFAASSAWIAGTEFLANRTAAGCGGCGVGGGSGPGGAIRFDDCIDSMISGCRFEGNVTGPDQSEFVGGGSGGGGAIACRGGSLVIASSRFWSNRTGSGGAAEDACISGSGGALRLEGEASLLVSNSEFAGNATGDSGPPTSPIGSAGVGHGGAISAELTGSAVLTVANCTVVGNLTGQLHGPGTPGDAGGIHVVGGSSCVKNSILHGNSGASGMTAAGQIAGACVEYCCVQGWSAGGPGNLAADPGLRDPVAPSFDLRLGSSSPCLEAADPALVPADLADEDGDGEVLEMVPTDLAGGPRFAGVAPDIGAHEFQPSTFGVQVALAGTDSPDHATFDPVTGEGSFAVGLEVTEDPANPGFPTSIGSLSIHGTFDPTLLTLISVELGESVGDSGPGFGLAALDAWSCEGGFAASLSLGGAAVNLVADEPREVLIVRFAIAASAPAVIPPRGTSTEIRLRADAVCAAPSMAPSTGIVAAGGGGCSPTLAGLRVRLVPSPRRFEFVRGDCNTDGASDIADAVALLAHLFGAPGSAGDDAAVCLDACDVDDDGAVGLADAIQSLQMVLSGGTYPYPWPGCGADPTVDPMCCTRSGSCS